MVVLHREVEAAAAASFLGELRRAEFAEVLQSAYLVDLPAEAHLLGRSQAGGLWMVISGLVRIFVPSPDGRQPTVQHAVPGQLIGLAALFGGRSRLHAQTVLPSRLLALDPHRLCGLLSSRPQLMLAAACQLAGQQEQVIERLSTRTFKSVAQRVAEYLLDLSSAEDLAGGVLPLTQRELADAVGASRESVARALSGFRQQGLVETQPARLQVLRPEELRRVSQSGRPPGAAAPADPANRVRLRRGLQAAGIAARAGAGGDPHLEVRPGHGRWREAVPAGGGIVRDRSRQPPRHRRRNRARPHRPHG